MEYQTFEVTVDARADGRYEVRSRSPSGEPPPFACPPVNADELSRRRDELVRAIEGSRAARDIVVRENGRPTGSRLSTARTVGTALFQMLFTGPVLEAYHTSLALAQSQGTGLRLQLRVRPPELAALPWEFLFDPQDRSFVTLNPATPVVRYPEIAIAPRTLAIEPPLRILVMMASPEDLPQLDVDGERRRIDEALGPLREAGQVELGWVQAGNYAALQHELRKGEWHAFHFVGHGGFDEADAEEGGILAFESREDHRSHRVSASALGQLLRAHPSLRLVVLNACLGARASNADAFSSVAATLVRRGIPAVIAMQYEISDQAALAFAQSFYTGVAAAVPVDRAVGDARAEMNATREDSLEWGTPVLLMRAADGRLFATRTPSTRLPRRSQAIPGPITGERPAPPPPRKRWNWKQPWLVPLAVGLVPPVVMAAVLAAIPAPRARVQLNAEVSGFSVVLGSQTNLGEDLEVTRLGVSGLDRITVTAGSAGGGASEADAIQLTTAEDSTAPGRITLDLRPLLPAGSEISLALGEVPHSYVLKADSLEGLDVPVAGVVEVIIPGESSQRLDFGPSGAVAMHSAGRQMRLVFSPAHGAAPDSGGTAKTPLITNLPARGLTLSKVEQFVSGGQMSTRRVSTLLGGSLSVVGGGHWQLDPHQTLRLDPAGDTLTAALGAQHLSLSYDGEVKDVSVGSEGGMRTLKPSLLREMASQRFGLVLACLLAYFAVLGIAVRSRLRRAG